MTNSLNWGDLVADAGDGGNFAPIPDGDYDLKVVEAPHSITGTGKTMFKLKAEVQTGAHAKRLLWDNLVISPENANAMGFFFRKMAALGLTREYFQSNPTNDQIASALKGRSFKAKVGSRVWNGDTKNELSTYYPATAGGTPQFQGAAATPPAAAPAPAAAPPAAPAAPPAAPAAPPAAPVTSADLWGNAGVAPAAPAPAAPSIDNPPF